MSWQPIDENTPRDKLIVSTNRHGALAVIMWWPWALMEWNEAEKRYDPIGAWDDGERDEYENYQPYEPKWWFDVGEIPE